MNSYSLYSRFYDEMNGEVSNFSQVISAMIETHLPYAGNVLEAACGTGTVLKALAHNYEVAGFDLSEEMIEVAKSKLPNVPLCVADMRTFDLGRRFDVVYCVYDSINHLTTLDDWGSFFQQVKKHLNRKGLFIFDMHTVEKLDQLAQQPWGIKQAVNSYILMKVEKESDTLVQWNIKIFEHEIADRFVLHELSIPESSFPLPRVQASLSRYLKIESVCDAQQQDLSDPTKRVFFICRNEDGP